MHAGSVRSSPRFTKSDHADWAHRPIHGQPQHYSDGVWSHTQGTAHTIGPLAVVHHTRAQRAASLAHR